MDNQIESEIERLRGIAPTASVHGIGLVRVSVPCGGDGVVVCERAKSILLTVDQLGNPEWHNRPYWENVLPSGFVANFAPEMSDAEARTWLSRWEKLTGAERQQDEAQRRWTLLSWIHWFRPENRTWYWWTAVANPEGINIQLEIDDWPTPLGSCSWLFTALGALAVHVEDSLK